jgi:hypothetical protein
MKTSTVLLLVGLGGLGLGAFYLFKKGASAPANAATQNQNQGAFGSFLQGVGGGLGKGVGDWFASGYNSGNQQGPWAQQTSWYGMGPDEYLYP